MDREQQQCPLRIREPYQRRIWWVWSPLNTKAPELTGNMAHRSIQEDLRKKKKKKLRGWGKAGTRWKLTRKWGWSSIFPEWAAAAAGWGQGLKGWLSLEVSLLEKARAQGCSWATIKARVSSGRARLASVTGDYGSDMPRVPFNP